MKEIISILVIKLHKYKDILKGIIIESIIWIGQQGKSI